MKRLHLFVAAGAFSTFLLASACGDDDPPAKPTPADDAASPDATKPDGGNVVEDGDVPDQSVTEPLAALEVHALALDGSDLGSVKAIVRASASGTSEATTGSNGHATVDVPVDAEVAIAFERAGYATQVRALHVPKGSTTARLDVTLVPREAPLTLANAATGGTLITKHGAKVTFGASSMVDESGQPVTGAVDVTMTTVNPLGETPAFPGRFEGTRTDGTRAGIVSYGTTEFTLTQNGKKVEIAPTKSVTIELPIFADKNKDGSAVATGQKIALWSLDENTGIWKQDGEGTVVANPNSPTGFALRADVTHFTWWNCDDIFGPEAFVKLLCKKVDASGAPTIALAAGETCTVRAAVPDSARRPITAAEDTFGPDGQTNTQARIPADTVVELIAQGPNGTLGFLSVNKPASTVPVEIVIPLVASVPVSITLPVESAPFSTVGAAAGTVTGTVDRVEAFLGGVKVAEDTSSPYTFDFSTAAVPEGFRPFELRAIRNDVVVGLSDTRGVVVDRTAPVVTLTRLDAAAGDGNVKMLAEIQDLAGTDKVEFFLGTTKIGEDTTFPYELVHPLAPTDDPQLGFSARATDRAGNAGVSNTFSFKASPPTVALDRAPNDATVTTSKTLTFTATANPTGTASGIARVEFFRGAVRLGVDGSAPFTFDYTVTGADEPNLPVTARAIDNDGNFASASVTVPVDIQSNDTTAPTIALDAVASPVVTEGLELAATASDDVGVAKVEFFVNGEYRGQSSAPQSGKFRLGVDLTKQSGATTFLARAFDAAGNQTSATQTATVQIPILRFGGDVAGRLPHRIGCPPAIAVDPGGTIYMAHTMPPNGQSLPVGLRVSRLVANRWESLGNPYDTTAFIPMFGGLPCPSLIAPTTGKPIVAFGLETGTAPGGTNQFTDVVSAYNGTTWQSIFSVSANNSDFYLTVDHQGVPLLAHGDVDRNLHVERYSGTGTAWNIVASALAASVSRARIAVRPNGNIVAAYTRTSGPFSNALDLKEIGAVGAPTFLGQLDSTPDTTQSTQLIDLDVSATETIVTHLHHDGNQPKVFTSRHAGGTSYALLGQAADQLANEREATNVVLNGEVIQIFGRGANTRARRFSGTTWSAPVLLPISSNQAELIAAGTKTFFAYTFDTGCCGPDGAIASQLTLP